MEKPLGYFGGRKSSICIMHVDPIQQSGAGDMLQTACLPVGLNQVFMHKRYTDYVYIYNITDILS